MKRTHEFDGKSYTVGTIMTAQAEETQLKIQSISDKKKRDEFFNNQFIADCLNECPEENGGQTFSAEDVAKLPPYAVRYHLMVLANEVNGFKSEAAKPAGEE